MSAAEWLTEQLEAQTAKLARLHRDFAALEQWAIENREGNVFVDQVAQYAAARLAEWDQPLEEWEP